jgi:hypothetical protein
VDDLLFMEVDGSAHHNREDMDEQTERPPWHGGASRTCRVRDKESTMGDNRNHMLYSIFLENAQLLQ